MNYNTKDYGVKGKVFHNDAIVQAMVGMRQFHVVVVLFGSSVLGSGYESRRWKMCFEV